MPAIDRRLRVLAAVTEQLGDDHYEVTEVDVEATDEGACGSVSIEGELFGDDLPDGVRVTACDCSVSDRGTVRLDLSVESEAAVTTDETESEADGGSVDTRGETPRTSSSSQTESSEGRDEDRSATETTDDSDEETVVDTPDSDQSSVDENSSDNGVGNPPAYRNPDRLAAVYDTDATFAEMTEALGVDVTPQTVRKYMIEHGIHEPQSQPAIDASDAEKVNEQLEKASDDSETPEENAENRENETDSDGAAYDATSGEEEVDTEPEGNVGDDTEATEGERERGEALEEHPEEYITVDEEIPLDSVCDVDGAADLTLGELIDAAVGARTMYEVQTTLDLDTETTRALLTACDLLDLVAGRIDRGEGPDEPAVRDRVADVFADGHS